MDAIWAVAPPREWALLALASTLLLAGFILVSHALVRRKAHGEAWNGLATCGLLETTVRLGTACLLAGSGLWAATLHAPAALTWLLAGAAAGILGLQAVAAARTTV